MQISRRGALIGASAAAVAAGVPGTVQGKDVHVEALHAEWRAAEVKADKANDIADAARAAAYRSVPPVDDLASYPSAEAMTAAMKARAVALEAAIEASGAGALGHRADAAFAVDRATFNKFMEAPSKTPRGLYLKFKAGISEYMWDERAELQFYENIMLRAIRADLERLAGRARS